MNIPTITTVKVILFRIEVISYLTLDKNEVLNVTTGKKKLEEKFKESKARIFLLYSTHLEAEEVFEAATKAGLTGEKYLWIATQSVVGNSVEVWSTKLEFSTSTAQNISLIFRRG